MTSPEVPFPDDKVAQSVFEEMRYGPSTREVGKNLTVDGYKKLLKDGISDDPAIIKDYFNGQWDCEREAIKALAVKLNLSETCINGIWPEIKEVGKLTVGELEDGCVVIYESFD